MKTNTFFNGTNNTSAGSSYRVPSIRHFTTPYNETMQGLGRHTNNIAVIDCEKRKKREHEYLSRVHIAELDIPTAAFFPDLDDDAASSTSCSTESTSLERRPFKRQALSLETENHDTETDLERHCDNDSDCESDNEIIVHILKSVPRLKLRMRATTSSSKDTHPHIIPEEAEENDKK